LFRTRYPIRELHPAEFDSVIVLDGPERFRHFVKRVVDSEMAWGLWKEGWALMRDDDGSEIFPLWPAREYSDALRTGEWADYEAEQIDLEDLLNDLLPKLAARKVLPGVFPTPHGKGVTPTVQELERALREEMAKYGDG
jgi:uncharacterized protein DUF2750